MSESESNLREVNEVLRSNDVSLVHVHSLTHTYDGRGVVTRIANRQSDSHTYLFARGEIAFDEESEASFPPVVRLGYEDDVAVGLGPEHNLGLWNALSRGKRVEHELWKIFFHSGGEGGKVREGGLFVLSDSDLMFEFVKLREDRDLVKSYEALCDRFLLAKNLGTVHDYDPVIWMPSERQLRESLPQLGLSASLLQEYHFPVGVRQEEH